MHRTNLLRLSTLTAVLVLTLATVSLRSNGARPAEASVNKIQYSLGCTDNHKAEIAFYWYGGSASARQVWIDASTYLGYWDAGTYTSAGPFTANDGYYEWKGLASSTTYYVRVNQQLANGAWDPSETYSITTESCL